MPVSWSLQALQACQGHRESCAAPCVKSEGPGSEQAAMLPVGCCAGGGEGEAPAEHSAGRR